MQELLKKYRKNELKTHFEQNFTTGSYKVEIGHAWCSSKVCEICSCLKKLKIFTQGAQIAIDQFFYLKEF
jgi:hypothetical protein